MTEQPQAQIFSSSVKIDTSAKGLAVVTVHVYANNDDEARDRAIKLYMQTLKQLQEEGTALAAEISKSLEVVKA